MATVDIGDTDYPSFADVDYADEYLAADIARAAGWGDSEEDDKGRGLVSATRFLQRLPGWVDGVPDIDTPPEVVKEATSMLAADMLAKPALQGNPSGASNVKRVKAGSAEAEFFYPSGSTTPIPSDIWALLVGAGLIGAPTEGESAGFYATGIRYRSHFPNDCCDSPDWIEPDYRCG